MGWTILEEMDMADTVKASLDEAMGSDFYAYSNWIGCPDGWLEGLQATWSLGLSPFHYYSEEDVRKKYKRLALLAHPDKPGGSEIEMARLNHALKVHVRCRGTQDLSARTVSEKWRSASKA